MKKKHKKPLKVKVTTVRAMTEAKIDQAAGGLCADSLAGGGDTDYDGCNGTVPMYTAGCAYSARCMP